MRIYACGTAAATSLTPGARCIKLFRFMTETVHTKSEICIDIFFFLIRFIKQCICMVLFSPHFITSPSYRFRKTCVRLVWRMHEMCTFAPRGMTYAWFLCLQTWLKTLVPFRLFLKSTKFFF